MRGVAERISEQLDRLLPPAEGPRGRVADAMRYATLNGGKRLRPFLTVTSAGLFDVPEDRALRAGAALEMVHCYSLVHDDLPAMDDSELRRGTPTVHRRYDDATAILAGDGLLTEAFAVLGEPATHPDAGVRAELTLGLARAAGTAGMVGGQMVDISPERVDLDLNGVTELQAMKTGALIRFACRAGAILGGADDTQRAALDGYADDLGLAFQIADDLLDAESDAEALGKPAGQDAQADKATFVELLGIEGARGRARDLVESAVARLEPFGEAADTLRATARFVVERDS